MKQDTLNALQQFLAQQQKQQAAATSKKFSGKTGEEVKPTPQADSPAPLPEPEPEQPKPQPTPNRLKSPLKLFTIVWHEGGTRDVEGRTATNWNNAGYLMQLIGNPSMGYNKTGILVEWENGQTFKGRMDIGRSKGDFNPFDETISQYLQRRNIFGRDFDTVNTLQIEDEPQALKRKDIETEPDNRPEISTTTTDDLLNGFTPGDVVSYTEATETAEVIEVNTCHPIPFAVLKFDNGDVERAYLEDLKRHAPTPTREEVKEPASSKGLILVEYSDKAIAIIGETYPHRKQLSLMGGRFNKYLSCGAGWIFSRRKEAELRKFVK